MTVRSCSACSVVITWPWLSYTTVVCAWLCALASSLSRFGSELHADNAGSDRRRTARMKRREVRGRAAFFINCSVCRGARISYREPGPTGTRAAAVACGALSRWYAAARDGRFRRVALARPRVPVDGRGHAPG